MGYEVILHYYNEISKGEYDKNNPQTKTLKFGSYNDEVSLDELAKKIIIQMARRNIFIYDVEIFEFIRKKISFKETKDGILIKHKKFSFDGHVEIEETACEKFETTEENIIEDNKQIISNKKTFDNFKIPNSSNKKVLRYETFNPPDKILLEDCKKRGLKFTVGKKYPIFKERNSGNIIAGNFYYTEDDNGNQQILSERLFNEIVNKLKYGDEYYEENNSLEKPAVNGLSWDGEVYNMPNIILRK